MYKQKFVHIIHKKRTARFILLLSIVLISISFTYINGYIPVCLSVKLPIGDIDRIEIENYIEKYPELSDMPKSYIDDKLLYDIYGTDESFDAILKDYKEKLQNDGYSLEYEGTGFVTGKNIKYIGYLKGITAVGIIISAEEYIDLEYETLVIYLTGNAFDFVPLLNWYKEKYDAYAFNKFF